MGHHYVPQGYLRGFEDPDNPGKIWMYDKQNHRFIHASIRSVAQEADYYSEDAERELSEAVEGPAHEVLKGLRCRPSLNNQERMKLAAYIGTLLMRGPRRRRKALELVPKVREEVISEASLVIRQWVQTSPANPELKKRRLAELDRVTKKLRVKAPDDILKKITDPWPYVHVLECIVGMTWRIISAHDAGFFLTSDNPAFFFEADGLGTPESELTLPLSSSMALLGSWQGPPMETIFIGAKPELVKEINRRIAAGAERFIFYHSREEWVATVAEKKRPLLNRIRW